MLPSFLFLLFCFLAIGVYSATRKKANTDDYLLASRQVNPWLTALSAVSTNNSGFMFIGLIGATYSTGLSSMWLMVGWVGGDYLAWRWVYRSLRERSEETGTTSIPSFLGASPDTKTGRIAEETACGGSAGNRLLEQLPARSPDTNTGRILEETARGGSAGSSQRAVVVLAPNGFIGIPSSV